ncbi:MAG TPA: pilus assembly protein TadG-related protein [Pyrinomonadaceae bacterium]|nr:pilus assembly protein TadG-related protein [Pyrinomonadaceae bacterium]
MKEAKQAKHANQNHRRGERGAVLALSAVAMLSMLLATGLAIDISHFYTVKAEMQNAADASAVGAAARLNSTAGGIRAAVLEATKVLNRYDFNNNNVAVASGDLTYSVNLNGPYVDQATAEGNATNIRFVKVTIPPRPFNVSLSAIVISRTQNIGASATAGMSVGLTMNKFYSAYTFIESAAAPIQPGGVYTLTPKDWNNSSPTSYRILSYSGGDMVATGSIHAYGYMGTSYAVAHLTGTSPVGNLTAPSMCRYAQIGTNTRFGDYTVHPGANNIDEPPDTIIDETLTYAQYATMQGNGVVQRADGMANRRIMTLPIALNTAYDTAGGNVTGNDLGAFFIRKKVGTNCELVVEYIPNRIAVPVGTYTPGSTQMAGLSVPVLYK